jgi:threonine aldolase
MQTNIVIVDVSGTGLTAAEFGVALKERGVLANTVSETSVRFVTHYDVSQAQCEAALGAAAEVAELLVSRRVHR